MSRVGKTEGAGALHRGILEARLEKRAILPNFNVDIRDPKFLIGLRLTESNLRFRNFGFEMGFCPISQFPLLVTQECCWPRRGGAYKNASGITIATTQSPTVHRRDLLRPQRALRARTLKCHRPCGCWQSRDRYEAPSMYLSVRDDCQPV